MGTPRAVLVRRTTELDELVAHHGTRGQAEFFLRTREQSIEPLVQRHQGTQAARQTVLAAVPPDWRRAEVERAELARFCLLYTSDAADERSSGDLGGGRFIKKKTRHDE